MSDTGLNASLDLDIRNALAQVDALERRLADATNLTLRVDARSITQAIDAAVAAADPNVEVTGEAAKVTGEIDDAVDRADSQVDITADTGRLTEGIDDAVDRARPEVEVAGDTRPLDTGIDDTIRKPRPKLPVQPDTSDLDQELRRLVDDANAQLSGLDLDVEVDLNRVKQVARQVRREIEAEDPRVTVTANTERVVAGVREAIERDLAATRAQVTAQVNADTSGMTAEIDAAVDAADTRVQVQTDTAGIAGEVDQALQGASPFGPVGIDGQVDPGLLAELGTLVASIGDASEEASTFRGVIATLSVGAAAAGLFQLVDAASDLEQAVGGTTAIFGEAESRVVAFSRGAAESVGLTEEAARSLTSQLGGLLQGFGFTQREAAELSVTLTTLGADLAATFGGGPQEAVEALGAALRGETDPIERFGISLNAAAVESRALELGLASSASELTANAKAQAALSIITEQAANAQGQFAREANTTAGQMERARAEIGNVAAEIGASLQPAVNEFLATARGDLIPGLEELGTRLGPAIADAALALLPAFGAVTDLLGAAVPIVEAFAAGIEAIPDPVLSAVGAFVALRRVFGGAGQVLDSVGKALGGLVAPSSAVASGFNESTRASGRFRTGMSAVAGVVSPTAVALGALSIALAAYASDQAEAAAAQREHEADIQAFTTSLNDANTAVTGVRRAIEDMVEAGDDIQLVAGTDLFGEVDIAQLFADAGVSVDQFAEAVTTGGNRYRAFLRQVAEATPDATGQAIVGITRLAEDIQAAAENSIEAGIALGDWSRDTADAAIEAATATDGTINYARALDELNLAARAAQEEQDALAEAVGGVDSEGVTHEVTGLGRALNDLQDGIGNTPQDFVRFALAADAASLSSDQLAAIAGELGISADHLEHAIERTVDPINELADAAAQGVPAIGDLAGDLEEFSTEGFRDDLRDAVEAVNNFQQNLRDIAAASPGAAAAAAVLGPEYAQVLAEDARAGNTAALEEIGQLIPQLQGVGPELRGMITGELGPQLADATGSAADTIVDVFGDRLQEIPDGVRPSIRQVEGTIEEEIPGVSQSAAGLATSAARAFADVFALDPIPGVDAAENTLVNRLPGFRGVLEVFGDAGGDEFVESFLPDPGPGVDAAESSIVGRLPGFQGLLGLFADSAELSFVESFLPDPGPGVDAAESSIVGRLPGFQGLLGVFGDAGDQGFNGTFGPDPNPGLSGTENSVLGRMPGFQGILGVFGNAGDQGFTGGFGPDPNPGLSGAESAVQSRSGGFFGVLRSLGQSGTSGFASGTSGMPSAAAGAADSAAGAVAGTSDTMYSGGYTSGVAAGDGMADGISSQSGEVAARARAIAQAAVSTIASVLQIGSPSKVMRDRVGIPIAQGIAVGIQQGTGLVEHEAAAQVEAAVRAAQSAVEGPGRVAVLDPVVSSQAAAGGGAGGAVVIGEGAVQVNVSGAVTPAQAVQVGEAAGRGFLRVVTQRQVRATARLAGSR